MQGRCRRLWHQSLLLPIVLGLCKVERVSCSLVIEVDIACLAHDCSVGIDRIECVLSIIGRSGRPNRNRLHRRVQEVWICCSLQLLQLLDVPSVVPGAFGVPRSRGRDASLFRGGGWHVEVAGVGRHGVAQVAHVNANLTRRLILRQLLVIIDIAIRLQCLVLSLVGIGSEASALGTDPLMPRVYAADWQALGEHVEVTVALKASLLVPLSAAETCLGGPWPPVAASLRLYCLSLLQGHSPSGQNFLLLLLVHRSRRCVSVTFNCIQILDSPGRVIFGRGSGLAGVADARLVR